MYVYAYICSFILFYNVLFIAGELYVVSIRGVSFAGSLIQIVDPSLCVW